METLRIIILFINIIKVVVPIILIISLMIKCAKAMMQKSQDEVMKVVRSCIPSAIAAVLIFLVPTFVDIIARISFPNSDYTKCVSGISKESIEVAYNNQMDELIKIATTSLTYSDYSNAYTYLQNIKDKEVLEKYQNILETLKERLDQKSKNSSKKKNGYANVDYRNFKWHKYYSKKGPANKYYSDVLPYLVWAPDDIKDLNGISLPLIVWLHGSGELSYNISLDEYVNKSLPKVVSNWSKTGLDNIPAIIVAPQSGGLWAIREENRDKNLESIKAIITSAKETYNIDLDNVVLMGHSMGSRGVTEVSYEMKKKYSYDYFSKLVLMSGGKETIYPSINSEEGHAYFTSKESKGFGEPETATKEFFEWIGRPNDYRMISDASHGTITQKAMTLDENNDGISDLVYWLFGKNEYEGVAPKPVITKRFFIGDSRTVNMFWAVNPGALLEDGALPEGKATIGMDTWSCQSAMGYSWMVSTGIPNIESKLDRNSALIILMGVNGADATNYVKYLNEKLPEWEKKGIYVYFVSVNPTNGQYNYLNKEIVEFNNQIQTVKGLRYIDTHSYLMKEGFYSGDGLHYSEGTSQKIYNYIISQLEVLEPIR
jgi:hypothetical protein